MQYFYSAHLYQQSQFSLRLDEWFIEDCDVVDRTVGRWLVSPLLVSSESTLIGSHASKTGLSELKHIYSLINVAPGIIWHHVGILFLSGSLIWDGFSHKSTSHHHHGISPMLAPSVWLGNSTGTSGVVSYQRRTSLGSFTCVGGIIFTSDTFIVLLPLKVCGIIPVFQTAYGILFGYFSTHITL